jgi:hypothetical protein
MTEQTPGERPGHLDIDAVSAFVDRDLAPDEVATIEFHLTECPACHREVLEIRTTVMLLANLPQYAPRRSFCLGQEHARASRRRLAAGAPTSLPTFRPEPAGAPLQGPVPGGALLPAWLPGFQVAAVAIGALLFFVTTWDLATVPATQTAQLAAPVAMTEREPAAATMLPRLMATMTPAALAAPADADAESGTNAFQSEPTAEPRQARADDQGTSGGMSASEEVLMDEAPQPAPAAAPDVVASVTGAVPTPFPPAAPEQPAAEPVIAGSEAAEAAAIRPSWLRLAQLALALLLAWLVVSIVGLRRVRG